MPRARHPSLVAALSAALGTELQPAAQGIVRKLVIEHTTDARIAVALGCSQRTVRRIVRAYGWAAGEQSGRRRG